MARAHCSSPARARTALITAITLSLIAALSTVFALPQLSLLLSANRAAAQTAPPDGGFALHGGLGGDVDERTGQFSVTVPLTTVGGQGTAAVSVGLSWQQERAAASVDRSGWGAGWSIGNSFVDVTGLKRVYPADGGSYSLDPTEPSGLLHYKLRDLTFTSVTGILPRRPGAGQVSFAYELAYHDGRADYFDVNGNLVARIDRLGNRIDLTWRPRANNVWQPTSIVDAFGLATTFDYSTPGQVKVVSPARSDGVVATTTIVLSSTQGVQNVTDPVGNTTRFGYASVIGAPKPMLTLITAPTGARTAVSYQSPAYQRGLTAVDTLKLTDAAGGVVSPVQTFDLNPAGNNEHNFTGHPNHVGTGGQDALFASGDASYTYTTALSTGASTTTSTYDALHRLVNREIAVTPAAGQLPIVTQTHAVAHPVPVQLPALLPANYGHPTGVTMSESAATSSTGLVASPPRTTSTATSYDDHGRVVSATDEIGATTTTEYDDRYGLVATQTTTGADGSQAQTVNTLTDDGRNIKTSTTSVGTSAATMSARQTLSYEYDDDGQLATRTLAWAPGAEPDADDPGGGPDTIVTTFDRSVDLAQRTQTLTTTIAAGTTAAHATTATVDLVSGQAVSHTDGMGRTTTMAYDALGRRTQVVTPDGMTTTTSYTTTQSTVTTPDGRVTRHTVDLLGRTVSITDNVSDGKLVTDVSARRLSSHDYRLDGTAMTSTDQAGRTTIAALDAVGRTVSQQGPTGLVHLKSFDDGAAHTTVAALVPKGASQPRMSTSTTYDDADRAVSSQTTYAADTPIVDPVSGKAFDGLGQPVESTQNDLTVRTDRSGPGGIDTSSTATPQFTEAFPGDPMSAVTTRALTGAATSRTLQQGDEVSTAVAVDYDAAGNVVTATDPEGRATTYTYTPDGQPLTKTGPSGTVTTHTYDATSGLLSGVEVTAPGQPTRTVTFTRVLAGQPGAGQVETVTDGTDTITYGYDVDGHRTSVTYPDGTATAADYNDQGQLATTTDVTGAITTHSYDATDGTLTTATQRRGDTVVATVTYIYDELSRVATTTRGNGTVTTNTYTPQNQLATQTTADAGGRVIDAHSYTYDDHYNPATRTDTYAPGGRASSTGGTWSTVYAYDAYDRLTGSAVYVGPLTNGRPTGPAVTSNQYAVDVGGDVVASRKTTRLPGIRPVTTTQTSVNTIDDSGRLTAQQTGSTTTASQTFDDEGRVLTSLDGVTTTYLTDGAPATTTRPDGTTTTYTQWPDGSRRSATTTAPDGDTSTITYHYGVDGVVTNDSTSDTSTPTGTAATASYLLTTGREARTLLPGTTPAGQVTGTPAAPIDTGAGVGYYLRDRHTSVTGLVDDTAKVTATYAYGDYGTPARADGRPVNAGLADGGRTNPYTYLGASPRGPTTEAGTGLLAFADRTYDARQGRFTSPDPVDAHNRYQAFNANPITYLDLSGQITTTDIVIEAVFAALMFVTAIATFGASIAVVGAVGAAFEAGVEITAAVAVNTAASIAGTAANATGFVTGALLTFNDSIVQSGGQALLSASERNTVSLVNNVATAIAGATSLVQGVTESAVATIETATDHAFAAKSLSYAPVQRVEVANPVGAPDQVPVPVPEPPVVVPGEPPPVLPPVPDGPPPELPANNNDVIIANDPPPNRPPPPVPGQPPPLPDQLEALLPGGENLNPPDEAAFNGAGQVIPVVADAGEVAEDQREQQMANDPVVVKSAADPIVNDNDAPAHPRNDPGAYGPINVFENRNVILLRGVRRLSPPPHA